MNNPLESAKPENRGAIYVKSGEEVFFIVVDSETKKELSRSLVPTVTFDAIKHLGIADHRCGTGGSCCGTGE